MRYLLHDVFLESVKKCPNKIAIYQEDGGSITYQELNDLSNRFANTIKQRKSKIRQFPFVGILSTVNINSIAAILGTLKIGCAYVPLDEFAPVDRLKHVLQNTQLDTIVIDPIFYEKFYDLLQLKSLKTIIFSAKQKKQFPEHVTTFEDVFLAPKSEPEKINQVCDDLAYILHSSGSTGIPKGIMLSHRNARTFVDWMNKEFKVTKEDVMMSRAPFKFDLSVFDIFSNFKAGATLVCFNWNKKRARDKKHHDYVSLMVEQKATILYTTPSTFITLMNRGELNRTAPFLNQIMYAGEPFPVPQLIKLQQHLPKVKIANIYGPSETNIITCFWVNEISPETTSIPLGREVDDTEILVVSENGDRLCDFGEMGELWCRGGTVTLGYLGDPKHTSECLVSSPFHNYPAKYWRTGDYGYRDSDGCLHYRGRRDHMVKVRGYRIEIGDIEMALAEIPQLEEFCVVAMPDEKYGNRLYCFYSVKQNEKITTFEIKSFLSQKIPEYMMPFKFIRKTYMLKNSAGKIDRIELTNIAQLGLKK